jgi:uncharacterized membrane protein
MISLFGFSPRDEIILLLLIIIPGLIICPTIYLLSPLYGFGTMHNVSPFQSVFICLGAYPIYLLSLKNKQFYIFFSPVVCYRFFTELKIIAFDFHAVTLGPTLLAFIFWFYETKKFKAFWLTLVLFVGLQENFFILASAFGLFIATKYRDLKRGIPIFITCLLVAILLLFYIIPKVFGDGYYYAPSFIEKTNVTTLFRMLYTPGSKIDVVTFSMLSFGFLPLMSPVFFIWR